MPSLKDIRRRIRSVKSTQKITQAMKMVAAAKVKRAENLVKANRPYAQEVRLIFRDVYEAMKTNARLLEGSRYADLLTERPVKKVAIIVLSSDRGLCGSYNANIIKHTLLLEKRYRQEGIVPTFYLVGNKMIRAFRSISEADLIGQSANISSAPTPHDANLIAEQLMEAYHRGEFDGLQILYTQFISMISYKVTLKPLLPLKGLIEEINHTIVPVEDIYNLDLGEAKRQTQGIKPETLLEPNPAQVLDTLIPLYFSNQIYISLLESSASELAARMTAMSNASSNAAEMIGKLTLVYNKARQASITQEILEIVSGAQALK